MAFNGTVAQIQVDTTQSTSLGGRVYVDIANQLLGGATKLVQEALASSSQGDNLLAGVPAEGSYVQTGTNSWSGQRVGTNLFNLNATAFTAGTPQTIVTAGAGKKWRLMGFFLSLTVAGSLIFKEATVEVLRSPLLAANIGVPCPSLGNGLLAGTAADTLQLDVSASGSVSGFVLYMIE